MIREDRTTFWDGVMHHPAVEPHVTFGRHIDISALVLEPQVIPLRSDNGGFLFVQLDGIRRVYELHTLYTPEGWGREVAGALKFAFAEMFGRGCEIITTYEVEGNWRSHPPKSYGFKPAGDFAEAMGRGMRTWFLTRDAWQASPAYQRMRKLCQ